ncbi:MAG: GNAT family N-acetyltransferase [Actinomycetia bacterium]|nr:GNAT family N-acetyltransferase [Actinomycetes bacterium]
MELGIARSRAEVADIECEWRALAEAEGNLLLTPDWFLVCLDLLETDAEPHVVFGRDPGGNLLMVQPFVATGDSDNPTLGMPGALFGGDFYGPLAPGLDTAQVATETASVLGAEQLRRIDLSLQPRPEWTHELVGSLGGSWHRVVSGHLEVHEVHPNGGTYDEYMATRSRNLRQRVGRMTRKLDREHGITIRTVGPEEDVAPHIDEALRLHVMRRDDRGGSEWNDPNTLEFVRAVLTRCHELGWLRLGFVDAGGVPVATSICTMFGADLQLMNLGMDPAWGNYSPGLIAIADFIRDGYDRGLRRIQLGLGDQDAWKERWSTNVVPVERVHLLNGQPLRYLALAGRSWARKNQMVGAAFRRGCDLVKRGA